MNDRNRFHHVIVALIAACLSILPATASAQTDGTATPATTEEAPTIWFVLGPEGEANGAYFDIRLDAGESATVTATIGNGSSIPVKTLIYSADAYSDVNGGFALEKAGSEATGPTTWLDFPPETHDFEAQEGINKTFSVSVPEGTPPGQYITGLAIETAESREIAGDSPIRQSTRLITAVLITVPGPIESGFEIRDLAVTTDPLSTSITGTIVNTGNIRVRPEGSVVLTDANGDRIVDAPLKMGSVYAHDTTTFSIALPAAIPEGSYQATARLEDPDTGSKAALENVEITASAPAAASPLTIDAVVLTPMPSADNVVFVQASVTIGNTGVAVTGGTVTLLVYRDGELVDEHELASSLTVQSGQTAVDQPYIPADGTWASGTYTFEVSLSTTDPSSGAESLIGVFSVAEPIVIP
jgi:hypothetical protein